MTANERSFLIQWSLVTALAIAIVLLITPTLMPILAGGLAGVTIGVAQWFILRQWLARAYAWVGVTTIGFFIAVVTIDRLANVETLSVSPLIYIVGVYLTLGALIGTSQWLVLRRYFLHASVWIPISTIGYLVGIGTLLMGWKDASHLERTTQVFLAILPGLVVGVVTGIGMIWLLRHPVSGSAVYLKTRHVH